MSDLNHIVDPNAHEARDMAAAAEEFLPYGYSIDPASFVLGTSSPWGAAEAGYDPRDPLKPEWKKCPRCGGRRMHRGQVCAICSKTPSDPKQFPAQPPRPWMEEYREPRPLVSKSKKARRVALKGGKG